MVGTVPAGIVAASPRGPASVGAASTAGAVGYTGQQSDDSTLVWVRESVPAVSLRKAELGFVNAQPFAKALAYAEMSA